MKKLFAVAVVVCCILTGCEGDKDIKYTNFFMETEPEINTVSSLIEENVTVEIKQIDAENETAMTEVWIPDMSMLYEYAKGRCKSLEPESEEYVKVFTESIEEGMHRFKKKREVQIKVKENNKKWIPVTDSVNPCIEEEINMFFYFILSEKEEINIEYDKGEDGK